MAPLLPAAYRAAWVYPVAGPPVRGGVIEVDSAGCVAAIRGGPDRDAVDLGEVAVVPALVNAHVHLEFSDLTTPVGPTRPFPEWVRNVVAYRRGRTGPVGPVLRRGLDEVTRSGAAAVGEIATADADDVYRTATVDVTVFRELIGPLPEAWPELLAAAERHLQASASGSHGPVWEEDRDDERRGVPTEDRGNESGRDRGNERGCAQFRPGLSPHAPYTVPQELFERAVALAGRYAAPVAVHLAESTGERELLADGGGELVEMMRSLGLWRAELHPAGRRPMDWLRVLASAPRGLVVHGNYLDDEELDFLASRENLSLVYCPRTHAYFGHPPQPFRRVLDAGGRVALGTDGRSSNPDLDLWREATFLRARHPDLPSDTILRLVTRAGAEALGVADRHGVLALGRPANFVAVSLREVPADRPPDLFGLGSRVTRVFRRGVELAR